MIWLFFVAWGRVMIPDFLSGLNGFGWINRYAEKRWSDEEMARRKRMANKLLMASLAMFLFSLMPMCWVTCTKMFSEYYLVNNLEPISESHNQWVALFVCGLFVVSGGLVGLAMAAVRDIRNGKWHLLLLSFIGFLLSVMMFLVGWYIYGDSVFFRGCETGSCEGLVFFRGGAVLGGGWSFVVATTLLVESFFKFFR